MGIGPGITTLPPEKHVRIDRIDREADRIGIEANGVESSRDDVKVAVGSLADLQGE